MTVDSVNKSQQLYQTQQTEKVEKRQYEQLASKDEEKVKMQRSDKLELSAEAMKLQPIRQRINEGFYDRPEVMRETAMKLAQDLAQ